MIKRLLFIVLCIYQPVLAKTSFKQSISDYWRQKYSTISTKSLSRSTLATIAAAGLVTGLIYYAARRWQQHSAQKLYGSPLQEALAAALPSFPMELIDEISEYLAEYEYRLQSTKTFAHQVYSATFNHNNTLVAIAGDDFAVCVWNFETGSEGRLLLEEHQGSRQAVYSPNRSSIVITNLDTEVLLFYTTRQNPQSRALPTHYAMSAAFSHDGGLIVTATWKSNSAQIFTIPSLQALEILHGHTDGVNSAVFNRDDTLIVTASQDRTARIWNFATWVTQQEVLVLSGHTGPVKSAAFSNDSRHVVTASDDGTARIWDTATGLVIKILKHNGTVYSAVFNVNDTRVVTASHDGKVRIWDVYTGEVKQVLEGHKGPVLSAVLSSDDKLIVSAGTDNTVRLWKGEVEQRAKKKAPERKQSDQG